MGGPRRDAETVMMERRCPTEKLPMAKRPEPDRDVPNRRGNIAAFAAIALVAAALFWLVGALQRHNQAQDCLDSARRDCVALPVGQ